MQCTNCKSKLPPNSKFCSQCGMAVPGGTNLRVQQDIGTVEGQVVGDLLGKGAAPAGGTTGRGFG